MLSSIRYLKPIRRCFSVLDKIRECGFELSEVSAPKGNYIPIIESKGMIYTAGHLSTKADSSILEGPITNAEDGNAAAESAALNILSSVNQGYDLDKLRLISVTGYVNAMDPKFVQHPAVLNGASNLFACLFGEDGVHVRTAIGCESLPLNAAVEISAIFEIK
eukprot:TRINITY_DN776194_c0_g1_i1.p1 TRINITY_DN776194_c0_g1~~TRINITY_DN776194_c0_g1_i1.p1  ORF type:complete len:163 (-),score=26.24 TRINITY_DN776194_c0_g1_i1:151-639(-)